MLKNNWILVASAGAFLFAGIGVFQQIVNFNNRMISLQEMKKAEIESAKVEYGQCIIKIIETNQAAKNYRNDIMALAEEAGKNLGHFQKQVTALIGTQIIPQISPSLRETVQRQIISCRNAYTGRVDLDIKPMYVEFNQLQRQFPYSIYNAIFFHWKTEELKMPHNESSDKIFNDKKIEPLDLD